MKPKPSHADLGGSRYLALQRLARTQRRPTAELLQLYALESFLRRLVISRHDESLVLKGGMLLAAFDLRRTTRDVDLLILRSDSDTPAVQRLIEEITAVTCDDGMMFLRETVRAEVIRDDDVYPGVRVSIDARLATARIKIGVDLNVGDPVVPTPVRTHVPLLLGGEGIEVMAYPKAMVVAEKLVTALQRGRANTRWRDFADLHGLVTRGLIESEVVDAVRAVANHRGVHLRPLGEVLEGMAREAQPRWATWRDRQGAHARLPEAFSEVLSTLETWTRAWILEAAESEV